MTPEQKAYLLKHYRTKSVKELADALKADKKELQRELRKLLASEAPKVELPESRPEKRTFRPHFLVHILSAVFLAAVISGIYYRTLPYPFLNWDDPGYVTENSNIRRISPENLKQMFTKSYMSIYVPFTVLSFAVDYQFHHLNPAGYRATNVAIHAASAVLVYVIVLLLSGEWAAALGAALIFGIHPVQIESVIWVTERKNVLSAFFFFGAFLFYLLSRRKPQRQKMYYVLSLLTFVFAGFSKPGVVTLFMLLFVFDWCCGYYNEKGGLKGLWRYLPYLIIAFLFALITINITRGEGKCNYHGGSLGSTLLTMMVVMMKYFELFFAPVRLSLLYEFPVYPSIGHPHVALSFLALLGLGGGWLWLAAKDRKLAFWPAWYLIMLLPMLNLIPFPSLMNDRYLYIPIVGISAFLFVPLCKKTGWIPALSAILIFGTVLGVLNLKRQEVWAHPETFWLETQKNTKDTHQSPYLNLGMHYLRNGEVDKAIPEFEKVLAMHDDPKAYDGLGIAYYEKGDTAKSIEYFKRALAKAPDASSVRNNLGLIYQKTGNYEAALEELRKAAEGDPSDPKFRNNVGSVLMEMERNEESRAVFLEALNIDPDLPETLYNLGALERKLGNREEGKKYWNRYLELYPDHDKSSEVREKLQE